MKKVLNLALIAALAAGLLFFSIYSLAAGSPLADAPSVTAPLADPAAADQPSQGPSGSPVLVATVTVVAILFGVLALFPLVTVSREERGIVLTD